MELVRTVRAVSSFRTEGRYGSTAVRVQQNGGDPRAVGIQYISVPPGDCLRVIRLSSLLETGWRLY